LTLTPEQRHAAARIEANRAGFKAWLLHGVTGSGKTEVYLCAMASALAAGRQVLFLVPEIGLTPQLEGTIRSRFPRECLVTLHSALTAVERARNWSAAHGGHARIVLGTRSAVFAPLPQLGLVVVDEEHDTSYKQGESVRYSARDLAVWRARQRDVPIVLGSATPSLESYHAAVRGRYERITLTRRPNAQSLPAIRLLSMAGTDPAAGIAPALLSALRACLARGEQALVFINRRGYAPVLLCPACGWAPDCPRCSAHMVLHRARARMLCHHCGHERTIPAYCAGCGNADLQPVGFGTQRIEASLKAALPGSRLLRVDRDTTRARGAWSAMRSAINQGDIDLLVGTQLLSKGHDFSGLSLVCVLNADRSLYSTDFRAAEKLFAQLLQVSGRAGRGRQPGEVLIQTAFPAHPLYGALQALDYDAFARTALAEREAAGLPPFVHQALLRAEATRMEAALQFLQAAVDAGRPFADAVQLYDPTPAAMPRLQGRERAQLLVQCASRPALHRFLGRWYDALWQLRGTRARWVLDVDPLDI
jgi:primosomal protein N' (replication factor Y)